MIHESLCLFVMRGVANIRAHELRLVKGVVGEWDGTDFRYLPMEKKSAVGPNSVR